MTSRGGSRRGSVVTLRGGSRRGSVTSRGVG